MYDRVNISALETATNHTPLITRQLSIITTSYHCSNNRTVKVVLISAFRSVLQFNFTWY